MRVAVTGGAGYIGAHIVRDLVARGDQVLVIDDLSTGDASRMPSSVQLLELDLRQDWTIRPLTDALAQHRIDAVVHFAARKSVEESVELPAAYMLANVGAVAVVLEALRLAGVSRLVFSSTAAVYGDIDGVVDETVPPRPLSPYGASKAAAEELIAWEVAKGSLSAASLRYFNVAGAAVPALAERDAANLIPQVLARVSAGLPPQIFGADYPTDDGTCVRDFIHVEDVSAAHLAVLDTLSASSLYRAYNIGTGRGVSVRTAIDALAAALGEPIEPEILPRRAGDAAVVVADPTRILNEIGWSATRTFDDIVRSVVG